MKNAYHLATAVHDDQLIGVSSRANPKGNRPVWNNIWRSNVPLRIKHMTWRAATGAVATTASVQYRHLAWHGTCPRSPWHN